MNLGQTDTKTSEYIDANSNTSAADPRQTVDDVVQRTDS